MVLSEEEKNTKKLVNEINKPNKPLLQAEKFRIKKCTTKEKENQIAPDAVNKAPKAIEIISSINTNKFLQLRIRFQLNLVLKLLVILSHTKEKNIK